MTDKWTEPISTIRRIYLVRMGMGHYVPRTPDRFIVLVLDCPRPPQFRRSSLCAGAGMATCMFGPRVVGFSTERMLLSVRGAPSVAKKFGRMRVRRVRTRE